MEKALITAQSQGCSDKVFGPAEEVTLLWSIIKEIQAPSGLLTGLDEKALDAGKKLLDSTWNGIDRRSAEQSRSDSLKRLHETRKIRFDFRKHDIKLNAPQVQHPAT